MLVITRKSTDRISFPQLGITIHFVRVQGNAAKIGIDAPRDIVIVRDEVEDDGSLIADKLRDQWRRLPKEVRHEIRNELHAISVGLHLYKQQNIAGLTADADETFVEIQNAIQRLDENNVLQSPSTGEAKPIQGTVLLVEDNDNEREMLAGLLRLQGYAVECVSDGVEALEYLDHHEQPSVVLMDMQMPLCSGDQVIKSMRSDIKHNATRIYAISGSTPEDNGVCIGEGGVDRWFSKPLNPQYLLEAI